MDNTPAYPGTPQHQALLRQIVSYYQDDPRVLALSLFGSLARGTWDHFSDLDLDVVVRDEVEIDVLQEVRSLCATFAAIGERAVLVVPDKTDAADVVLESLCELSIRYHPLASTSPNIVESAQVLSGSISVEEIRAAGRANVRPELAVLPDPVDSFIRLALAVDREVQRRHFWQAIPLLESMRWLIIEMFAQAHGGGRAYNVFQADAPRTLQEQLAATLPEPTLASLQRAFVQLLNIIEQEQIQLGRTHGLSAGQQVLLARIRQRQQHVQFTDTDE